VPEPGESPLPPGTVLAAPMRDAKSGRFTPGNRAAKLRALKGSAKHLVGLNPAQVVPWLRPFVELANRDAGRLVEENGCADDTALMRLAEDAAAAHAVFRGLLSLGAQGDREALAEAKAWLREHRQAVLTLRAESRELARARPAQWPWQPAQGADEQPDERQAVDEEQSAPAPDVEPPKPAPEYIGRPRVVEMREPTPIVATESRLSVSAPEPDPPPPRRTVPSGPVPRPAPARNAYGVPLEQPAASTGPLSWSAWAAQQCHRPAVPSGPGSALPPEQLAQRLAEHRGAPRPAGFAGVVGGFPAQRTRGGPPQSPEQRWAEEQAAKRGQR
jgi:hypothetical protein